MADSEDARCALRSGATCCATLLDIGATGRTDSAAVKRREKPMMKRDPPTVSLRHRQGTTIGRPCSEDLPIEGKNKKDRGAGKSMRAPRLGCSWVLHPQHQR